MSETETYFSRWRSSKTTILQIYFSDNERVGKYSWAAVNLWNNFETISGKFSRAEIKLFQADIDDGWNNLISHVTTALAT